MPDFNLIKDDIDFRFPLNTSSHVADGDGWTAKSVVTIGGALVKQGSFRGSEYDAYENLRGKLLDGEFPPPLIGPGVWTTRDRAFLQTTNNTQTVIDFLTLADDTVCIFKILVIGIEDDSTDRGAYAYTATIYRAGVGAVSEGSITQDHIGFSDSNWIVNITVSGNDAQASVTGVTAETIDWQCAIQYMLSH